MPIKESPLENQRFRVIESWTATYSDPITVSAGDPITLNGREDKWDGYTWLWAENQDGKEGWVPDCMVSKGDHPKATETYSAMELTCRKGQILTAERRLHGWIWCSDQNGKQGWVPERHLRATSMS